MVGSEARAMSVVDDVQLALLLLLLVVVTAEHAVMVMSSWNNCRHSRSLRHNHLEQQNTCSYIRWINLNKTFACIQVNVI